MSNLTAKPKNTVKPTEEMNGIPSSSLKSSEISYFQGPIPPPHFLAEYERIVPGIAERFLNEPHIEAEHRRSLEQKGLEEKLKFNKRKNIFLLDLRGCLHGVQSDEVITNPFMLFMF